MTDTRNNGGEAADADREALVSALRPFAESITFDGKYVSFKPLSDGCAYLAAYRLVHGFDAARSPSSKEA